jgi:hypothetical protein
MVSFLVVFQELAIVRKSLWIRKDRIFGRGNSQYGERHRPGDLSVGSQANHHPKELETKRR